MRAQIIATLSAAVAGYLTLSSSDAYARSAVQRDVEGYAIASCLVGQDQSYLNDQGDGWASAIIQRGKGGLDPLRAVAAAVKAELAKGNMPVLRTETEPMKGVSLPIMYCSEIIDTPSVHRAIDKVVERLAPSYKTH